MDSNSSVPFHNTVEQLPKDKHEKMINTSYDIIDPSSVIREFLNLKVKLEELLQVCDPMVIVEKCCSLMASDAHNIPLFNTEYTEELQVIKYTKELIQKLSPFLTWDNHCILSRIAKSSNIPEAAVLLTQFDDTIDSSLPLTKFPIPEPSHHMVPYDNSTHTILAIKLDLALYQCTLQDVIDARSLIQDQCKLTSYCLQLLAVAKSNSTIIYWMIPKNIAHVIMATISQFQDHFYLKGIQQLVVYPGALLCTGSTLKVGPLSFFNEISLHSKQVANLSMLFNSLIMLYVF